MNQNNEHNHNEKKHHTGRYFIYLSFMLIFITCQLSCTGNKKSALSTEKIHFYTDPNKKSEDPEEILTYGLFITSPWKGGGFLYLNFPEHLEYNPVGNTILRHYDSIPNPWIISPDSCQASFRVESLALKDVYVEAFTRVLDDRNFPFDVRGVHVAMRIINHGSKTLPVIRPLICNQFRDLTGFPQHHHDFKNNHIIVNEKIIALSELPTKNMNTTFKGCVVKSSPQRDTRAEKNGGLIEKDMDMALSVVTSMDHERKVIFWWTPGKSMIANSFIPCIHADPYFGTLKPGEEAYAEGLILFTEGKIKPIVNYLKKKERKLF